MLYWVERKKACLEVSDLRRETPRWALELGNTGVPLLQERQLDSRGDSRTRDRRSSRRARPRSPSWAIAIPRSASAAASSRSATRLSAPSGSPARCARPAAVIEESIGGKTYFANCAWDTVSLHMMVGQDTEVSSFCHHCAEPIKIRLSRGRVASSEPEAPLIFLSVPVASWYDNLINTCSNNMVYFGSKEHRDRWLESHRGLWGKP